ncbi:MAG: SUMF1/EgtB/PvdO family nonheme iron enzyme [Nodosilinea sp.]
MPKIFISYRRSDSEDIAGRVHDRLMDDFDKDSVFFDVETIPYGLDFRDFLKGEVQQCQVLIAIIGPDWLSAQDGDGHRRIDDPADWVRIEIESALARDIPVIPLLVRGARLPRPDELPDSLRNLAYRNAATARAGRDFHMDMGRLIEQIEHHFVVWQAEQASPLDPTDPPAPPQRLATTHPTTHRQEQARQQPATRLTTPPEPAAANRPAPLSSGPSPSLSGLSRRRMIQIAGCGGGGLVLALAANSILRNSQGDSPNGPNGTDANPSDADTTTPAADLTTFNFEVVTVNEAGEIIDRQTKQDQEFEENLGSNITLSMVAIPAGEFVMGSPPEEEGRADNEGPQGTVRVPSFFMGSFPVTQAQYQAVMGENPSSFAENGAKRPVETVSWYDAIAFCEKLSQQTGRLYRLPSEAEWEYACRANTTTPFNFGPTITTDLANYRGTDLESEGTTYPGHYGQGPPGSFREQTTDVGSFPPNAFGLYDMHGNVWEWCADHQHDSYEGAPTDSTAWLSSDESAFRMLRGGSWYNVPASCRSARRISDSPDTSDQVSGFRVVCEAA